MYFYNTLVVKLTITFLLIHPFLGDDFSHLQYLRLSCFMLFSSFQSTNQFYNSSFLAQQKQFERDDLIAAAL